MTALPPVRFGHIVGPMKRQTLARLRCELHLREYLRLADEGNPPRIHRGTEHKSRRVIADHEMTRPILGNAPLTSEFVYDKHDPKKLRRFLKSQTTVQPGLLELLGQPGRQGRRPA